MREEKTLKELDIMHQCMACKSNITIARVGLYVYNFTLEKFPKELVLCDRCTDALEKKLSSNVMIKLFLKSLGIDL